MRFHICSPSLLGVLTYVGAPFFIAPISDQQYNQSVHNTSKCGHTPAAPFNYYLPSKKGIASDAFFHFQPVCNFFGNSAHDMQISTIFNRIDHKKKPPRPYSHKVLTVFSLPDQTMIGATGFERGSFSLFLAGFSGFVCDFPDFVCGVEHPLVFIGDL